MRNFFQHLAIGFRLGYKDIINRISYNQRLVEDVNKKTAGISNIFERVTDAFVALDKKWQYTYVNEKAAIMHGRKAQDLDGKNIWTEFPDVVNEPFYDALHEAMEKQEPQRLLLYYSTTDKWFEDLIYPSPDGVSVYYHDITEKKKAEEELKLSKEKLQQVLSSMAESFYVIDKNHRITLINKVAEINLETAWGYHVTVGTNILDHIPADRNEPIKSSLNKAFAGEKVEYELHLSHNDLPPWWLVTYAPVFDECKTILGVCIVAKDITERRKAEEKMRESENQLSVAAQIAKLGYWEYDILNKLFTFNDQFYFIFKTTAEKVGSYTMSPERYTELFVYPYDRAIVDIETAKAIESKDPDFNRQLEHRIVYANGEVGFMSVHFYILKDKAGHTIKTFGINQDITDRKKAEEDLRRSNNRFELITSTTNDAVWEWNLETGELWANEMHQHLYGLTPSDPVPTLEMWTERIHPDDRQVILKRQEESLASDKNVFICEYRFNMPGKGYMYIYDRCYIVRNREGKPVCMMGSMMDITERKKAQQQIEKEKILSDSVINSLPGVFYLFDKNGKYIRWNKLKEKITEYTADEMKQRHPLDFFEGAEKDLVRNCIEEAFMTGKIEVEAHLISKSGKKFPYYFTGMTIEYEGNTCLIGMGIDISERKKAELDLEESYNAIRHLTDHLQHIREEERIHIAREIHDELGQQLTVMKMDLSWLNKKLLPGDEFGRQKLKGLIDMLDGTVKTVRRISSELRPSLLDDMGLVAAMEWQLNEFEQRSGIKTSLSVPGVERQLPDSIRTGLFRIFQESLTNVVKHAHANHVRVNLQHTGDKIILSIEDDGKGYDKKKATGKRTLGILGMRERTLMMGGEYEINSSPGKGTTVLVAIPGQNLNSQI